MYTYIERDIIHIITCICIYVYVCMCVYIYIYIYTCIYIYIYIYIHNKAGGLQRFSALSPGRGDDRGSRRFAQFLGGGYGEVLTSS